MPQRWNDSSPIYQQLADRLAVQLLDGDPPEGQALPSVRNLASHYLINPLTVGRALQALVVAEAMACQRVVVATDSGGVKEVLGDAGGLVPARDPEALARGLRWALSLSERERAMLGERARRRVQERFSLDAAAARWLALYAGTTGLA